MKPLQIARDVVKKRVEIYEQGAMVIESEIRAHLERRFGLTEAAAQDVIDLGLAHSMYIRRGAELRPQIVLAEAM